MENNSANNKIKEIHESIAYGILIETGCGLGVSSALLEVEGAHNTVFFAECPYSKDFQEKKYNTHFHKDKAKPIRAVSKENIDRIIAYHEYDLKRAKAQKNITPDADKINFIYAASFQIGDYNDISTHGWIGIWTPDRMSYYHISIHASLSRKEYIKKIAQIGVDLLHHCTVVSGFGLKAVGAIIPCNCCIDIALTADGEQVKLEEIIFSLRNEDNDNFLCFKEGKAVRMEDLFRDQKTILLYKGSFNPIHAAHVHAAELAKEKYGVNPVLVISSSVYQKGWISPADLANRATILNELGYSVIITRDGHFNKNTEYLREKFKQPIVYVVGSDTLNRILESTYKILNPIDEMTLPFPGGETKTVTGMASALRQVHIVNFEQDFTDVHFFVVNRPGSELKEDAKYVKAYYTLVEESPDFCYISSTQIREMKKNNDIEGIRKLIPAKIFDKYINLI